MKVFGIGLSKTGTFSLAEAFVMLGYRTAHCPWSIKDIEWCEAASDITISVGYKFLDAMYPGSKFILTTRAKGWLKSCEQHWRRQFHAGKEGGWDEPIHRLHEAMYGTRNFNPDLLLRAEAEHFAGVESYFLNRPNDLLMMDICAGDGWEKLCPFLGKEKPAVPFPHSNIGPNCSPWRTRSPKEGIS